MNDAFPPEIGNYFTKEEWQAWVRGEINIFDLFIERTGMTKEDADRLRNGKPTQKLKPPPITQNKSYERI